jgi:uncharacterized repeat protein (TIGR01451 family)
MAQITNQANLTFNYGGVAGSAISNIATATLLEPLSAEKTSIGETFRANDKITYVISVQNNGNTTVTGITVTDNLGTYTVGATSVTPLTYDDSAALYINGVFSSAITGVVTENSVTFTIPALAPGANALIIYQTLVNDFAPLASGGVITNTATITTSSVVTPITVSDTVTVADYADISIQKEMSPDPVSDGDLLTYTFTITNTGNTAATGVVLTDNFDPAPTAITVTVDGTTVPATAYTYENGVLILPTGDEFPITVPAATVSQDPVTGNVTVTPGTLLITVVGTI